MIDNAKIGRAIRTLREKAGLKQKELAEQLFVSNMAVSKWESGKSMPDVGILKRLSKILDMDIDSLIDGAASFQDDTWKGIILLDLTNNITANTSLYDKPLIDYQISYFLLAGIREIVICCSEEDYLYTCSRFREGESLGIRLYHSNSRKMNDLLQERNYRQSNIMLISEALFIYGVDLTRFMERAIQNRNVMTNMTSVIGKASNTTFSVAECEQSYLSDYLYQSLPVFFFRADQFLDVEGDFQTLLQEAKSRGILESEPMNKGFLVSPLRNKSNCDVVIQIVKMVQTLCGYTIYCPLEIAWRRGIINRESMVKESIRFPEYNNYIKSLQQ